MHPILHQVMGPGQASALNEKIALFANSEIYGSDQTEVARLQTLMGPGPPPELSMEPSNIMGLAAEQMEAAEKSYDRLFGLSGIDPSTYPSITGSDDAIPVSDLTLSTIIRSMGIQAWGPRKQEGRRFLVPWGSRPIEVAERVQIVFS